MNRSVIIFSFMAATILLSADAQARGGEHPMGAGFHNVQTHNGSMPVHENSVMANRPQTRVQGAVGRSVGCAGSPYNNCATRK